MPAAAFGFLWLSLGTIHVGAAGVWRSEEASKGWVEMRVGTGQWGMSLEQAQ